MFKKMFFPLVIFLSLIFVASTSNAVTKSEVIIGLNVPLTGPYWLQGKDQLNAYILAKKEINKNGGILGKKIRFLVADSKSNPKVSVKNVENFIKQGVDMVTGGSSSGVAVAVSKVCQKYRKLFLATLTYSNATTGKYAHRHTFRETYNAWMAAKALGNYLNKHFSGKKYFYITADYTWGWTTRDSMMKFTGTKDATDVLVPLGERVGSPLYRKAIQRALDEKADVLVLVLFGRDMIGCLRQAIDMGAKKRMQIVVPNFELHMAVGLKPPPTSGVLGAVPWYWEIPSKYNFKKGIQFVKAFRDKYQKPPGSGGGTAYTNLMLYKWAVEKVNSFDPKAIIQTLEGHSFVGLKDQETIRPWDHQTIQSVYVVKGKGENMKGTWDLFEVIGAYQGDTLARTRQENPVRLEPLD